MIRESAQFKESCFCFSTLVSQSDRLESVYDALEEAGAVAVKTIPMGQGNKISRIVVWTFLTPEQQEEWKTSRWMRD